MFGLWRRIYLSSDSQAEGQDFADMNAISLFKRENRTYWAGVALSGPIIVGALPSWTLALAAMPWLASLTSGGVVLTRKPSLIVGAVLALAVIHLVSLLVSTTPFRWDVSRDLIIALACSAIFLSVASIPTTRVSDGFFAVVTPLAIAISALGLVKFGFQKAGLVFAPIVDACGYISVGTTFCGDYNMYALFLLIGAIGVVVRHFAKPSPINMVWLSVVLCAGFFAGSRRFIFLLPLVPAMWVFLAYRHHGTGPDFRQSVRQITFVFAVLAAAVWLTPTGVYKANVMLGVGYGGLTINDASGQPIGPTELSALLGSMSKDEGYGLGSRSDRWRLGVKLIAESPVVGHGFAYHEAFSCKFVKCQFIDYPHAPILSAWLMAGLLGLAAVCIFYFAIAGSAWRAGTDGIASGATPLMLAVLPYSLISGDTVFSLPMTISAAFLLQSVANSVGSLNEINAYTNYI